VDLSHIFTSISIGLLATTSPCVFPLYPGFLAYISASGEANSAKPSGYKKHFMGVFVLLGVLTMMLFLGAIISALSLSIGKALAFLIPIADLILITLGLLLIFNRNPFSKLPQIRIPVFSGPYVNAFMYGLLYGPIALPCSGPLVVSIFTLSLRTGAFAAQLATFLWFGLGLGLPLLALSFLGGALQRPITIFFARHSRWINLFSGLLILSLGVYDLILNLDLIRSGLGF
jgi:cytochrome c-type biogenesis protein